MKVVVAFDRKGNILATVSCKEQVKNTMWMITKICSKR